ncbi:MAG: lipid A deacylase LpxR family protein [Burkholderiaceae bacterium]
MRAASSFATALLAVLPACLLPAVPAAARCRVDTPRQLISIDNDVFTGTGSDSSYTSGVRLERFAGPDSPGTPLDDWVERLAGDGLDERCTPQDHAGGGLRSWYAAQEIYTPREIRVAAPQPNDRPWAGALYAGRSWEAVGWRDGRLLMRRIEVAAGVIGDASLARETQRAVHRLLDTRTPRGWDNQLRNQFAVALRYLARQRWGDDRRDLIVHYGGVLASAMGYANAGATVRYGRLGCELASPGVVPHVLRISGRPWTNGGDACAADSTRLRYYGFVGVDLRAVGWNRLIDGAPRRGSSHVEAVHAVGDVRVGAAIGGRSWSIIYTASRRSREFQVPGLPRVPPSSYAGVTLSLDWP